MGALLPIIIQVVAGVMDGGGIATDSVAGHRIGEHRHREHGEH